MFAPLLDVARLPILLLLGVAIAGLAACSSARPLPSRDAASNSARATPASFPMAIYNRTRDTISIGPAVSLALCSSREYTAGDSVDSLRRTPPPGAKVIALRVRVPRDYQALISVVVSSIGTEVTLGRIESESLPECQGSAP